MDPKADGPELHPPLAPRKHRAGWLASIQSLATTVVIAVFVITFLAQAFQIPSESMENTLLIGDYLLVDKVRFGQGGVWGALMPYSEVRRGDIIVFRYPLHPAQHFVKRVVALPGDRLRLINKRVLVNGRPVDEEYAVYKALGSDPYRDDFPAPDFPAPSVEARWWMQLRAAVRDGELVVPADCYFVLGDNRDQSLDSRYWGFVPGENVIGRPLLIYWSVDGSGAMASLSGAQDDRLSSFAYAVSHLFQDTRWNRTFQIVK